MKKVAAFFKNASPLKLVLVGFALGLIAVFFEKPYPSIFLGLRLMGYVLFFWAIIRYFNSK
ncbi:hypothetical protein ABGT15_07415 [Flavobacterium enshiense]|uniref:hypothetical protein n=1 Tax=Flavobacterium enshiense TaxID=1341165 RepID=UPI00345D0104